MRFKQQRRSQLPEVNLVPMMDVLMTVLTFFIILAMTLTGQQMVEVQLPKASAGTRQPASTTKPLLVGLNAKGQTLLENRPVNEAQLNQAIQAYLLKHPQGTVALKADRKLPYKQVIQILETMQAVGGDRVSLAIERN